jgi:hypothetical protein
MGAEAKCTARINGKTSDGTARLETETLEFRGPNVTLSIPFKQIKKVTARDGALTIDSHNGTVSLMLGGAAEKWAFKIQHPPSRLDKIGVKQQWRVSVLGMSDEAFLEEIERAVSQVSIGRVLKESDAIFVGATKEAELARLAKLKDSLKSNGALWVIRPKGRPEISERAVMVAGRAAGLVDVKVVSFSPTHTAEKFVIPVHQRRSREGVS